MPARAAQQDRRDEATDVLHHAAANREQLAIATETAFKEPRKNWRQSLEGFLRLARLDCQRARRIKGGELLLVRREREKILVYERKCFLPVRQRANCISE